MLVNIFTRTLTELMSTRIYSIFARHTILYRKKIQCTSHGVRIMVMANIKASMLHITMLYLLLNLYLLGILNKLCKSHI